MADESASTSAAAPLGSSVIPVVNKLQDIFANLGSHSSSIDLPQVAVVGSQSSGKSSVLESLVGRDFLPRGSDICTRRPLVLQLIRVKDSDGVYGEFLHLPGQRFHDFSEIRREIQAETDREAGGNKGVSNKQIRLKVFSPNVLDITLVDLPGITKVPVGDQPSDIEAQIRTMIMSYIEQPSCLILAITPANSDLANSDALKIARNVDPDGYRTIGVITKLDIMDRGTDARNLLLGKIIPLRLGYVGVVNRCQEDILLKRSIKDALVAENKFFRNHPVYNGLTDHCGIPQLAKKLNKILMQHINAILPSLKSGINSLLVSVENEHANLGEIKESKDGKGAVLLNILSKYCEAFSSMIDGGEEISITELSGGARIHYVFQSIFVKSLEELDPCEDLADEDIRTAICNAAGSRSALFVPGVPFDKLVRRQIARLLDPSLQCVRFIFDELIKISHCCMVNELQRFPFLRKHMDEVAGKFLQESIKPSKNMIKHIVEMEMDYINTSHKKFIGGSKAIEIALQRVKSSNKVPVPVSRPKDGVETDKAPTSEGFKLMGGRFTVGLYGNTSASGWGIPSMFGGGNNNSSVKGSTSSEQNLQPVHNFEQSYSTVQLREPASVLKPSGNHSEQVDVEILVIKLLIKSYFDIVRNNIEDLVPKAIMHFQVNRSKRELHNVFIKKLYRENLFEELLKEPEHIATKRKQTQDTLQALQQAIKAFDELPLDAETVLRG